MKSKILGLLAMGLLAGPMMANAVTITDYTYDVAGIYSVDGVGASSNEVRTLGIGANGRVIGIGWDVTLFADIPSWLAEMVVSFGASSSTSGDVNLTVGIGDDFSGTKSYLSGGVVDLIGLGLDFNVDADGVLRMEFYESFDDFAGDFDGRWESGALTIRVETESVPEPGTLALLGLGLAGLGLSQRRRLN